MLIQIGTTYTKEFGMVSSTDHVTAVTDITPVVTLSKAGSAFAAAAGTVTEISAGWYKIALTIVDTNTLRDLAFHCTGTGADPNDFSMQIVAFDPFSATNLGLTNIPSVVPTAVQNRTEMDSNSTQLAAIAAKTSALSSTPAADVVTAMFTHLIETGVTFQQFCEIVGAVLAGNATAAGSIKAIGNPSTPRASAVLDGTGNRTMTLTL